MKAISTALFGQPSLLREGIAATIVRSHFRIVSRLDVDAAFSRRTLSRTPPALCICITGETISNRFVELVAALRGAYPLSCIVSLSNDRGPGLKKIFDAGVNGSLPLGISPSAFTMALDLLIGRQVSISSMSGETILLAANGSESLMKTAAPPASQPLPKGTDQLSSREFQVLDAITKGESNKHIARRLAISEATVKAHIRIILRKIGVENRTQAAVWALSEHDPPAARFEPVQDPEILHASH